MARHAEVRVGDLADGLVLAPERYDPRRRAEAQDGRPLGDLVTLARQSVRAASSEPGLRYRVFDTSDARAGFLAHGRPAVPGESLGSTKRVLQTGDVLISRLRPYLQQVAWVDPGLVEADVVLCCSAEFYVLRPHDDASIAFLVPWLLSEPIQAVLAAAQEGGHHPRFDRQTLLELPVAGAVLAERDSASAQTSEATAMLREGRVRLARLVSGG